MEIKNVSIIGLGALGILFGNQLSKKLLKENLRIIADKERIEKYKNNKVYCNGEPCDFNFITPEEKCEPADLIIFTVKYSSLKSAINDIKNHVGENTLILSALNGISSEEIIGEAYGMDKVIYCVAQGMDAVKIDNRLTYHNKGMLCFGETEPGIISPRVERVADFFDKVELPYEAVTDMMKRLWGKFMLNVGVNQTCSVFECNYEGIQKDGEARDTMIKAMREVIALSHKACINLNEDDLDYWLKVLSKLSPDGMPSMRQDMVSKRYSEVDLFSGTVIELGKKYNVQTPVNQKIYEKVKLVESNY